MNVKEPKKIFLGIVFGLLLVSVTSFSIDESFAETPEFVTEIMLDGSFNQISPFEGSFENNAFVEVDLELLKLDKMNLTIFGETYKITHEQTMIHEVNEYTYVGSSNGLKNNVFIAVVEDKAYMEMSLFGKNIVLTSSNNDVNQIELISHDELVLFGHENPPPPTNDLLPNWQEIVNSLPTGTYNSDDYENVVIDVIFLYTDNAKKFFDDNNKNGTIEIRLLANMGISKTNIAFETSDIPVEVRKVSTDGVGNNHRNQGGGSYVEAGMVTDLERLILKNDGYMERGNAVRDNENADIGVLFNYYINSSECGRVLYILTDAENAFAGVSVNCDRTTLKGNIIAHEIGHLLGGRHQPSGDSATDPFAFGHGFESNVYQTIMHSSPCYPTDSRRDCVAVTQWSDPNERFFGTSIPSGIIGESDNARVMMLTGSYVASFKGGDENYIPKDSTSPIISIISPTPNQIISSNSVRVYGTITENETTLSSVTIQHDSNPIINLSASNTFSHTFTNLSEGSHTVTIKATNSVNLISEKSVTFIVDTISPVITLNFPNPQSISQGDTYNELGAVCIDNTVDISSRIVIDSSSVNTGIIGSYNVTYDCADSANNDAIQVIRSVNVVLPLPLPITYSVSDTITVGKYPSGITVNESTNTIYSSSQDGLKVINGTDNTITKTIPIISTGVVVNEITNTIYTANSVHDTVSVINGYTNEILDTITVGDFPYGITVNESTKTIYVTNFNDDTVSVIDIDNDSPTKNTVTNTITVGEWPRGIALNEITNTIYVTNLRDTTVSVINGNDNTVTATILVIPVSDSPWNITVNERTNTIYVSHGDLPLVSVIDGYTNEITTTITVKILPIGIVVNQITNTIFVNNAFDRTVSVINGYTNIVIDEISVGNTPMFMGINESTNTIYVANMVEGTISVITGSTQ